MKIYEIEEMEEYEELNWWEGPTEEDLEKEYLDIVEERARSYTAFAGSYD